MTGMSEVSRHNATSPGEKRGRRVRRVSFRHPATGETLATSVRLANTSLARLRGLMFTRCLPAGAGLWLRPCQSIHSFWMFYSIDAIFLDRNLRIVKLVANLRPFRLTAPKFSAHSVLELPPGTIERHGLKVGDQLVAELAVGED